MGAKWSHFNWTAERLQLLDTRFPTEGPKLLAQEWNLSVATVENKARSRGLRTERSRRMELNKCHLKDDYFKTWSDEMAYWLGYIFADGCVRLGQNPKLSLLCQTRDEFLILQLRETLGSNHQLTRKQRKRSSGYVSELTKCEITNANLAKSLAEIHGVVPAKSRTNPSFPTVPEAHLAHFIRGFFDGDGCVSESNRSVPARYTKKLFFKGSHQFIASLYQVLIEKLNLLRVKIEKDLNAPTISKITWANRQDLTKLYHFLYPPGQYPYLPRKRTRLEGILGYTTPE